MSPKVILILFLCSCTMMEVSKKSTIPKEFSQGEIILANQLLTKIFDREMAPIKCVPDLDEASLLLRTINPRMAVVQDDLEAMLDSETEIQGLIEACDKNCTCSFIDELFRENLVVLRKENRLILDKMKKQKDLNSCLNYGKETFCDSELYKELSQEKVDFSFDE